jgi:hypothetical protein
MKVLALTVVLALSLAAFADHHEEHKKMGHDKEHSHVEGAKMDHDHDDAHHKDHDHKAHHPEHADATKTDKKMKKEKKK